MRASSSFIWICIAIAGNACSGTYDRGAARPKPSKSGQAAEPEPAEPEPDEPESEPEPELATCTSGDDVDYLAPSDGAAVACFVNRRKQRDCWRIDTEGEVTALPRADWPEPGSAPEEEGRLVESKIDETFVKAPASLKVKINPAADEDAPPTIEVCNGTSCKSVRIRQEKKISMRFLYSLTVLPDGRTLLAGLGLGMTGAEAIDRYDLDKPKAKPTRLKYGKANGCGLILDVLAGNLLIQTTDCANAGGPRVLMTPAGKLLANLGEFGSDQQYHAFGGNQWLFESFSGLAIWDLARAKRIAATKGDDHSGRSIAVVGGSVIAVEGNGTIIGYDAKLKATELGSIPRCE